MKKYLPHILIVLVLAAVVILFITGNNNREKQFNDQVSFKKRDKIPYGTYVAYENLKHIFPLASIEAEKQAPRSWKSLHVYGTGQVLLIVSPSFNPDEEEMKRLINFVENGNDVFISTMRASYYAEKLIKCDIFYPAGLDNMFYQRRTDSLSLSLEPGVYGESVKFSYPGRSNDFWFYKIDSSTSTVLGYDKRGKPDFIRLSAGNGHLFLHLAPMAFSNYFLLHKNNIAYYEKALSVLPAATTHVVWDEYFISKREDTPPKKSSGWLSVFFRYPSLRWGLLTALLTLFLFVLVEMRRKQRYIPVVTKPKNDSLEFVKTIGRLYYDKGDHRNLSRKMSAYFLEYVRNRYKLSTTVLDDKLVKDLQFKTGMDENELQWIVSFITRLEQPGTVSDRQLADFHKKLEQFYQHS